MCVNLFILNKCSCWRICQNGRPKIIQKIGRSQFAYVLLLFSLTPSLKTYYKLLQWKVPCLVPFITSYVCICIYVRFLLKIYHGMTVLWVYFFAKNKMLYFISKLDGSRNTCDTVCFFSCGALWQTACICREVDRVKWRETSVSIWDPCLSHGRAMAGTRLVERWPAGTCAPSI